MSPLRNPDSEVPNFLRLQHKEELQQRKPQQKPTPPQDLFTPSTKNRPMSAPAFRSRAARQRLKEARQEHGAAVHQHDLVKWLRQRKSSHKTEATIQRKRNLQTWFNSLAVQESRDVVLTATKADVYLAFVSFGLIDSHDDLERLFKDIHFSEDRLTFGQFESVLNNVNEERRRRMTETLEAVFNKVTEHRSFSQQYDIHRRNKFMAGIMHRNDLSKQEQKIFMRIFREMASRI
jgi:hypothetical protein